MEVAFLSEDEGFAGQMASQGGARFRGQPDRLSRRFTNARRARATLQERHAPYLFVFMHRYEDFRETHSRSRGSHDSSFSCVLKIIFGLKVSEGYPGKTRDGLRRGAPEVSGINR